MLTPKELGDGGFNGDMLCPDLGWIRGFALGTGSLNGKKSGGQGGGDRFHVEHVVRCLQREIRTTRRNVGALKLSNLLRPDRFEEDLGISRLRVRAPTAQPNPKQLPHELHPTLDPEELERRRLRGLDWIAELRRDLA